MAIRKLPFSPMVGSTGFRKTYRHWSPPVIEKEADPFSDAFNPALCCAQQSITVQERNELRTSTLRNGLAESGF